MSNKHFVIFLLVAVSITVASCNRGDIAISSVNNGGNTNSSSNEANKGSGGHVTVLTGDDIASVTMRSTRFR
ncbi:MAG: hypothetical protein IT173_17375 [Acidobacteria bacterium]|nr:hypothetical protein [Acidobacteriota bacterium]